MRSIEKDLLETEVRRVSTRNVGQTHSPGMVSMAANTAARTDPEIIVIERGERLAMTNPGRKVGRATNRPETFEGGRSVDDENTAAGCWYV